ncbi:MAG TPA: phosphopantetheine-binding protein [bacterium]|nr:phosphopantetheine-binding protein [bacterium]
MSPLTELTEYILREIAVEHGKESLESDENLLSQGLIDSMGILKLVSFIESNFGIKVDNEDIVPENFETLNDMSRFVEKKKNK